MSGFHGSDNEARINPSRHRPQLGHDVNYPISVSGECGVIRYLRTLAISNAVPDSRGQWSAQDIVLSATRISAAVYTTKSSPNFGPTIRACRIDSRLGHDDLFFHIVNGVVKSPGAPNGWQLTSSTCNPGLELLDDPLLCKLAEDFDVVEDASHVEHIRLKDEVPQSRPTRPSMHYANSFSSELLFDAACSYTLPTIPITNEERAKRAEILPTARRMANINGREVELIAGAILWNGSRIPLKTVTGLRWQTRRSEGEGWIRLRVDAAVFEVRWDVVEQPSTHNAAHQLVGMLLSELRSPIVEKICYRLAGGVHERFGDALITEEGVQLKAQGFWRSRYFLCSWKEVETAIDGASVLLTCVNRQVVPVRVGLDVENAFALHFLPSRMLLGKSKSM